MQWQDRCHERSDRMQAKSIGLSGWKLLTGRAKAAHSAKAAAAVAESARSSLTAVRDELRARLLVHDPATQAVRHLYLVYKQLREGGWAGVAALEGVVVRRSLAEAEMLQGDDPSPLLGQVVERLRAISAMTEVLAEAEAEAAAKPVDSSESWAATAIPDVSETSYDEYEQMERSWIGTVPSAGPRPEG